MKRPGQTWLVCLIVLLALVPVGLRVATWKRVKTQPVDLEMAKTGEMLFKHEWTPNDPLANGGDGLGPVFNANSCVACHNQGGVGGAGGLKHNVTLFTQRNGGSTAREGVVHARATSAGFQETLSFVDSSLPKVSQPTLAMLVPRNLGNGRTDNGHCIPLPPPVHLSQRNTPALFGAKLIDDVSDREIVANERSQRMKWGMASADNEELPVGRALRLGNGKIGKFGWKAQTATLADFVQAACANELGLGNPGQAQPRPLGRPDYTPRGLDLTLEQCNQLTMFVSSLQRPSERYASDGSAHELADTGKKLFHTTGCADCHTPNVGSVEGIYSDLLLHRMGEQLVASGSYNDPPVPIPGPDPSQSPSPGEWRTPPLWGIADSGPYLHDGRAATLEEAIQLHDGQGRRAANRFAALSPAEKSQLIAFLKTMRAPQ